MEDELPSSDGMPMETERHVLQMYLLTESLRLAWADRSDVFIGGNMFVYFSPDQVRTADFRGPDVFVAQGVERRERKSWVVWQEGKAPDLVIELLSESTARQDKTTKKRIYQDTLRVPEYVWYDPFSSELAGFALVQGVYEEIPPDERGGVSCIGLGLTLVRWKGAYGGVDATWLRWATPDGTLLPTPDESTQLERVRAEQERLRAEQERLRAEEARLRAEQERERADEAERRNAELLARIAQLEQELSRSEDRP
jgi:Uma2 family endonuclease